MTRTAVALMTVLLRLSYVRALCVGRPIKNLDGVSEAIPSKDSNEDFNLVCKLGFVLVGISGNRLRCSATGQWEPPIDHIFCAGCKPSTPTPYVQATGSELPSGTQPTRALASQDDVPIGQTLSIRCSDSSKMERYTMLKCVPPATGQRGPPFWKVWDDSVEKPMPSTICLSPCNNYTVSNLAKPTSDVIPAPAVVNEYVTLACNAGYKLTGIYDNKVRCIAPNPSKPNDIYWDHEIERIRCKAMCENFVPKDLVENMDTASVHYQERSDGEAVDIVCLPGFKAFGKIKCEAFGNEGTWKPLFTDQPSCKPTCPPPDPDSLAVHGMDVGSGNYTNSVEGDEANVSCFPGFEASGKLVCTGRQIPSWRSARSPYEPRCNGCRTKAGNGLSNLPTGTALESPLEGDVPVGTTVQVKCVAKEEKIMHKDIKCVGGKVWKVWDGSLKDVPRRICQKLCPASLPKALSLPGVNLTHSNFKGKEVGQVAVDFCAAGFRSSGRYLCVSTDRQTAAWAKGTLLEEPQCRGCRTTSNVNGSSESAWLPRGCSTKTVSATSVLPLGSIVEILCDNPEERVQYGRLQCDKGHVWKALDASGNPRNIPFNMCRKKCPVPLSSIAHIDVQAVRFKDKFEGDVVPIQCRPGYEPTGSLVCARHSSSNEMMIWKPGETRPSCKAICSHPRSPAKSTVLGPARAQYIVGDVQYYRCTSGKEVSIVCLQLNPIARPEWTDATCSGFPVSTGLFLQPAADTTRSSTVPLPAGFCPDLEIENGSVMVKNNTRAEYTCARNYHLLGPRERWCQEDGNWSGDEPKCVEVGAYSTGRRSGSTALGVTCLALGTALSHLRNTT